MALKETNQYAVVDPQGNLGAVDRPYDEAFEIAKGDESKIRSIFDSGRPDIYDGDIHGAPTFTHELATDGSVTRYWNLSYSDDIRYNACRKVDYKVESHFFTQFQYLDPYRIYEYKYNEQEANDFLAMSDTDQTNAVESDWPFLAAGIGCDKKYNGEICESLADVANLIQQIVSDIHQNSSSLRTSRKDVKYTIENAATKEEAFNAYWGFLSYLNKEMSNRKL